ncbi:hypothetical protein [Streptomyces murinus]|uniref:hypothetical protein n=1 Tax=Streptomyces murinus TaxID=33900 RepID=UPI0018F66FA0|nr:hypothetical protein [Streptomyces murinus]
MSRTGPRDTYADYEPSERLKDAIAAWEAAVKEEERLRHAARAAVADELRNARVVRNGEERPISHGALAAHVPWTEATVTGIAKEYKVPPSRQRKTDSSGS